MGVIVVVDRESESDEIEFDFEISKPVWRINKGNGVPSDLKFKILTKSLRLGHASNAHKTDDSFWLLDNLDELAVYAYQTTRTKAAKYERVECGCKDGVFYMPSIEGGYYEPHPCDKCKGKGYRLEAIK